MRVYDEDPARVARAVAALRERGFEASAAGPLEGREDWIGGPARVRLWEPNPFLAECLPRIVEEVRVEPRALDIACGSGRDAVFMAFGGFAVTALDVLPDALARARDLARRSGVALETRLHDLEREPLEDEAAYDLVLVVSYLQRSLMPAIRRAVRPGGFVVYETFLARQAEIFGKPRSPDHLLAPGELAAEFADWRVIEDREGLAAPRRLAASLLARKPG